MEDRRNSREIRNVIALRNGVRWICLRHADGDYWICGHCKYGRFEPYDRECFNCHAEIQWEVVKV